MEVPKRWLLLWVANGLLIAANIFLIWMLATNAPAPEFVFGSDIEIPTEVEDDVVYVADITAEVEPLAISSVEDLYSFEGTITVLNEQEVGVPDVVVTAQMVVGAANATIEQFVTNRSGIAAFEYTAEHSSAMRIEILDVIGDGIEYRPELNLVRVVSARFSP